MATRKRKKTRDFDIVLWGATGFTGRLVAIYLARNYASSGLKWAIGGRNRGKLEQLRDELLSYDATLANLELVTGDSHDRESLDRITERTTTVCTTVGPYDLYGEELVASCVDKGTHYCDLTGETPFIRRMIDRYHERAVESGARIVHCCGFDSIPSDIGTFVLQQQAQRKWGAPANDVTFYLVTAQGGFSGGTVSSLLNVIKNVSRPEVRSVLGNPYALNPEGERSGPDRQDSMGVRYDKTVGAWTGPFLMAPINTRVVRRSNALMSYAYGKDFTYREVSRTGRGPKGLAMAAGMSAGLVSFMAGVSVKPIRKLLEDHVLPAPGEGPTQEQIERGSFVAELVGKRGAEEVRVTVRGRRDPGYGATAGMLAESALCLSLDKDKLTSAGGILTPASAMGDALVERLPNAEVTVTVS